MVPKIKLSPKDRDALIRTVWGEARGEAITGQSAVVWVILNRALNPGWWGGPDVYSVCHKPYQFSCWLSSDPNAAKIQALSDMSKEYATIAALVDRVLSGGIPNPINSCDTYKVSGTKASWDNAVSGIEPIRIGHHSFYHLGLHPTAGKV